MYLGTHQVVSKHSILGAQMESRHEEFRVEELEQRMEGWIAQLEEIKRLLKRRKQEGSRHRTRRRRASSRRSWSKDESNTLINEKPRDVEEETEDDLIDLKVQNSDGIGRTIGSLVVAVKTEAEDSGGRGRVAKVLTREGEGDGRRDGRFHNFSDDRCVGGERDEVGGDLEPPQDQVVIEAQKEVVGTLATVALGLSHDPVEELSSLAEGKKKSRSDGTLEEVEMNGSDRELPLEEPAPEESLASTTDCDAIMAEAGRSHDSMKVMSSPVVEVFCGQWKDSTKLFSFRGDSNWLGFSKCSNKDVLGGWCDSGSIFVAEVAN